MTEKEQAIEGYKKALGWFGYERMNTILLKLIEKRRQGDWKYTVEQAVDEV